MASHSSSSFNISIIALFYIIINLILAVFLGLISDQIMIEPIGFIGAGSIILFLLIIYLSLQSDQLYFTLIIFIFIAFPSKVDNIFPAIAFGIKGRTTIAFQLITHIDIYLLIGIIKGVIHKKKAIVKNNYLYTFSIGALIFSYIVNSFFKSESIYEYLLLATGFYQLRYLVLIYFLFSVHNVKKYKYQVLNGVYLSIAFLLIESSINTFISGGTRLSSGTLNLNTLGNITALIGLVLFIIGKKFKFLSVQSILNILIILIAFYISFATETRIAIISVIVLGSYLFLRNWKNFNRFITISFVSFLVLILIISLNLNALIPSRYQFSNLTKNVEFDLSQKKLKDQIKIHWSPETSSIITRLDLYQTSINMITENPLTGIGANRWNFDKAKYGSSFKILINSHNGYLNVIAENGLLAIPLIILMYFYPFYIVKNKLNYPNFNDPILFFSLINLGIAICDLSNSTINKHSIFAFLAFNTMYVIFYPRKKLTIKIEEFNQK